MRVTFYHYPKCSTCRNAAKWLREAGVEVESVDLTTETPGVETLGDLYARSGLELRRLFNTSGQSYRGGGWKDRLGLVSEAEALAALAADGMLIKRPILDTGAAVLVGFDASSWAAALAG